MRAPRVALAALAVAALAFWGWSATSIQARLAAGDSLSFDRDRAVGQALTATAAPGAIVLNTRWDEFPFLAWHAPAQRYVTGLDPNYLGAGDADRHAALATLNGEHPPAPDEVIDVQARFNTDWVVTDDERLIAWLQQTHQVRAQLTSEWNDLLYVGDDPAVVARLRALQVPGLAWRYPPATP